MPTVKPETQPESPPMPYLGAIVIVHTPNTEVDGQHDHAAIVTRVTADGTINALVFRAIEPHPMAFTNLPPESWDWPSPGA